MRAQAAALDLGIIGMVDFEFPILTVEALGVILGLPFEHAQLLGGIEEFLDDFLLQVDYDLFGLGTEEAAVDAGADAAIAAVFQLIGLDGLVAFAITSNAEGQNQLLAHVQILSLGTTKSGKKNLPLRVLGGA